MQRKCRYEPLFAQPLVLVLCQVQTTAYTRFEEFAERLHLAVETVLAESEQDRLGVIHRVGLRYIDVVRRSADKGFRFYVKQGLHGVPDEVFQPGRHLLHIESHPDRHGPVRRRDLRP